MIGIKISSINNSNYKHLVKLVNQPKVRRRTLETVLHGIHLCEAYLDAGKRPKQVFYSQGADHDDEVRQILSQTSQSAAEHFQMPTSTQRLISGVDNGVGLAFVIDIPAPELAYPPSETALFLDGVQNPGNVGTMLRIAAAAGVKAIYLSTDSSSAWSPKALRAGMGGQLKVEIYENCDLADLVQKTTLPVMATALSANQTIYEADLSGPVVWLFGSEGTGVSHQLLQNATHKVTIPQAEGVESLNVAAAAAICLFEQRRQQNSMK